MVVRLSTISRSLSLGITIKVSTLFFSCSIPDRALLIRVLASKRKGLVTTPTVRIPISFAILATTGAAPVPVPPPIPQVTNTISAPFKACEISSELSSAAFSPTSGLAPAPSPLVSFSPICMAVGALQNWRACLSVLMPINSTPAMFSSIMRLTALFPAPPTPTTIILAAFSDSFILISNKIHILLLFPYYHFKPCFHSIINVNFSSISGLTNTIFDFTKNINTFFYIS